MRFDISVDTEGAFPRLILMGEVDVSTSPEISKKASLFFKDAGRSFIIDLRDLKYIDATGLSNLIGIQRKARDKQLETVLVVDEDSQTWKNLELMRLDQTLTIKKTLDEAVAFLTAKSS